jgi:hypothetical protein
MFCASLIWTRVCTHILPAYPVHVFVHVCYLICICTYSITLYNFRSIPAKGQFPGYPSTCTGSTARPTPQPQPPDGSARYLVNVMGRGCCSSLCDTTGSPCRPLFILFNTLGPRCTQRHTARELPQHAPLYRSGPQRHDMGKGICLKALQDLGFHFKC